MRRPAKRVAIPLLIAAVTATAPAAHANRLLFESYVGNRPADAVRLMPLVRTIFEHHGFTADPLVLAMMFREHAYRPGLANPNFAEVLKRSERRSEEAFWNENYLKAIDDLANLIVAMRQNPLIFTREPKYRELALRVLVFHALACGRQARVLTDKPGEAAKFERLRDDTLAETLRSYPSKVFSAKDFGDEGAKLLAQARDRINQLGRGRISITTSDPDAQIYINEIVQGTAKVDVGDFTPGIYRVLIVVPSGEARQYEIEVTPNQTSRLNADWNVDSLLVLDNSWAGFKYPTEKDHALEATLVHQLATTSTNASIAATVTVAATRSRVSITGTSYNTGTGQIFRSGRVELAGNVAIDTQVTRLAECLVAPVGTPCGEGVLPVSHPEFTPPPPKREEPVSVAALQEPALAAPSPVDTDRDTPRSWPKWATAGGAVVLVAGGAYLFDTHYHCSTSTSCDTSKPRLYGGLAAIDTGIALGAFSAFWLYDDKLRANRAPGKWLVVGGAVMLAAGITLYAFDQDPSPNLGPHYWDTAPQGVALGALGLASIGVGAWAWTRSAHTSSIPTVSVSSSHALVGWAGGF